VSSEIEERYVTTELADEAISNAKPLTEWPLDDVWAQYEEVAGIIKNLYRDKDVLEAELGRRLAEEHPEYSAETGGSVDLAGQSMLLHVTMDRTYAYREDGIMELQRLAAERPEVLSPAEFEQLVPEWTPKVSGTVFNALCKRGGLLADMLNSLRYLQRSKAKFERKARA
jgi:hypothetical protein